MDNFIETYSSPKLNLEEIHLEQTNQSLDWNRICNYKKKKKTPYKQKSRTRWLHRQILPTIQRRTYTNFSQTLPEDWRGRNTSKDRLWSHHYPDAKTRQRHYKKTKIMGSIFDEYWYKNFQQNMRKLNPTTL